MNNCFNQHLINKRMKIINTLVVVGYKVVINCYVYEFKNFLS